jgi:hypothetical protein
MATDVAFALGVTPLGRSPTATSSDKDRKRPGSTSSRRTYGRSSFHMINMALSSDDTASGNTS